MLLDGNNSLAFREISNIRNPIDTFITFDPETFEEIIKIVPNKMDSKLMTKLELIQDWVWNKDKKELEINFIGFAPLIHVPDHDGNYQSYRAILFRRPDKDK